MAMQLNGRVVLVACVVTGVIIVVLLALTIHGYTRSTGSEAGRVLPVGTMTSNMELLVEDGIALTWHQSINSRQKLTQALQSDTPMMLEVDLMLTDQNDPVIAASPGTPSEVSLTDFLNQVAYAPGNNRSVLLNFRTLAVLERSVHVLAAHQRVAFPVWLRGDVIAGDGRSPPFSSQEFISAITSKLPHATLGLGWTTSSSEGKLGQGRAEAMWEACRSVSHPVSFFVHASMVRQSWPELRWLLGKSSSFSMTVYGYQEKDSTPGATAYDLLYVRNDWPKETVFYDVPTVLLEELRSVSATAGNPLHFFNTENLDAARITWGHAVNSISKLDAALKEGVMFLEADVRLEGIGTANQTTTPIMAHPPDVTSDLTLADFLARSGNTKKGLKLDFKDLEALEPALRQLQRLKPSQPVWLNADILQGPNSNKTPIDASVFLSIVDSHFPAATLSIGWTTGWSNSQSDEGYRWDMVRDMHALAKDLRQPVTFPIRAAAARRSWEQLDWLLQRSRGYTLTIWTSAADDVQQADMQFVRNNAERSRVYYDLPDELMPA